MEPGLLDGQAVRQQLERVLQSGGFSRNERLTRFLRFVVERHLEGREDELKEAIIGIEVCRKPNYDPKKDSVVRTEAGRLRARLAEYYEGEGRGDPVVMELPKGGYTPVFRRLEVVPPTVSPTVNGPRKIRFGRPWIAIALAGIAAAAAALGGWWVMHNSPPIAIAVLPLTNLSQDLGNDYFADGLTDEIIRNLSLIDGLAVRSQTSSFVYKGKLRNVREAGRQLEADYILEGSVLRAGQQLRINIQLVRVRDDLPLWSGRFDRELTDILAIQDEISRGIVNSLRLKLGRGRRRYEISAEAYDLYLRARASQIQRGLFGNDHDTRLFEEAIAKDSLFAPAYAGLAGAYAYRSGEFGRNQADELAKMRAAAEKAIQLDPLLAEAHDALGIVSARDGLWEQSEKSFRRAIELERSRPTSYGRFALYLLLPLGRIREALLQLRVAEKIDPLSPEVHLDLAWVLLSAGRYDEAAGHCLRLPTDYLYKSYCLGRALLGQGRIGDAIQVLATAINQGVPEGSQIRGELGYAYGRAGRREEAEKLAAAVAPNPFLQGLIFAGLGDKERTFEAVERLSALGPVRIGRDLNSPEFALIRGDPRVKALRKKVGLPE